MVEVLNILPLSEEDLASIKAVDPSVNLTDAQGWFNGEICETWPSQVTRLYLGSDRLGKGTREERDAMLEKADVFLCGWPYPLDVRRRAPNLKWLHHLYAGEFKHLPDERLWRHPRVLMTPPFVGGYRQLQK